MTSIFIIIGIAAGIMIALDQWLCRRHSLFFALRALLRGLSIQGIVAQ